MKLNKKKIQFENMISLLDESNHGPSKDFISFLNWVQFVPQITKLRCCLEPACEYFSF